MEKLAQPFDESSSEFIFLKCFLANLIGKGCRQFGGAILSICLTQEHPFVPQTELENLTLEKDAR